jgi:4-diphosphocytidyl-2-C-methyl-D-erythritol kinase
MPSTVRSHAKINLGLAIGPIRSDGYHSLVTLYQTLELEDQHDRVTVSVHAAPSTQIVLTSNHPRVPTDQRNTVWRMVEQTLIALGLHAAVAIHIEKRLPIQGGLGAGSANAAAALIALERELERELAAHLPERPRLPAAQRLAIAAAVGSDVPLFLIGGAVLGLGHGEEVYPLPDLPSTPCVIAVPATGVSTPQAFRDWDALHPAPEGNAALTASPASHRLEVLSRSFASAWSDPHSSGVFSSGEGLAENPLLALVRTGIENDFEQVVFQQHPSLGHIKRLLACSPNPEQSALYAALSGSGSALFGLYPSIEAAKAAQQRVEANGTPALLTRTLQREEYWRNMVTGA